uniref:hypothetical protein n=1 Tax=Acidianus infernus TaxID=12915 RepID=UPI003593799E
MKTRAALLALLILLLMSSIFYSDVLYYYHARGQFCTIKIIKVYTNHSLHNPKFCSSVNPGNNVSIKICEYNPPPPNQPQKLINVTTICLPKSSKVFLIPIIYNISENGKKLSYCCISLTFTSPANTYKACLVSNASPQNKTFYFVTKCNYYFVNVCWTFCGNPNTAWASILLMFIIQEGGANYVFFWSINIT